jgi:hypothetical protein
MQAALEEADRMSEFAPCPVEKCQTPRCHDQAVRMIERLGDAHAFLSLCNPFIEFTALGKGHRQIRARHRGGKPGQAAPFPA